jgi:hypothetical protein
MSQPTFQQLGLNGTVQALAAKLRIDAGIVGRFFAGFAASPGAGRSLSAEELKICWLAGITPGAFAAHQVAQHLLQAEPVALAGKGGSFADAMRQIKWGDLVKVASAANVKPEDVAAQMGFSAASIAAMKKAYEAEIGDL